MAGTPSTAGHPNGPSLKSNESSVKNVLGKRKHMPESKKAKSTQPRKRVRIQDARAITVQTTGQAFKNGEVDVDKYVKAREFEIKALEDGLNRAKMGMNGRAFQELPRELRRRTASHNVKRVPKRLRARAAKEMVADNTPTVTARKRQPTRHMRLRLETAKRLQKLSSKTKAKLKKKKKQQKQQPANDDSRSGDTHEDGGNSKPAEVDDAAAKEGPSIIQTRPARARNAVLRSPAMPPARFRKRQMHKTWLPTHMYHTKRAHMTPPKEPLWRFALPLTPTMKGYRATHRASVMRGAVAWDTSYMSTIGLEGTQKSVWGLLKALGITAGHHHQEFWDRNRRRWLNGTRVWQGWLRSRSGWPTKPIAPATVIWCAKMTESLPLTPQDASVKDEKRKKREKRQALIRIHPSAFLELWEDIVKLSKVQKPAVIVEDLRFEIGSIELTGPASAEALTGILWPVDGVKGNSVSPVKPEDVWSSLGSVTQPSSLPSGALLGFSISDPRLHYPPRTVTQSKETGSHERLLQILSSWPIDSSQSAPLLFDRNARLAAGRALPSQRSINRRRGVAEPGAYPEPLPKDPKIPVLLFVSENSAIETAGWTLMLPWKAVLPVWYSLMYYPISTGGNVRFGGLREKRQIAFEAGKPWFPGDFPGTNAGAAWEAQESESKRLEWERRPKGKRIEWASLDLGNGRKGELGKGWACDWDALFERSDSPDGAGPKNVNRYQLLSAIAEDSLISGINGMQLDLAGALVAVRLSMLSRGLPTKCARVYRLPTSNTALRQKWLSLTANSRKTKAKELSLLPPRPDKDAPAHVQERYLATSILYPATPRPGHEDYPSVPDPVDMIGFVTTGNFNLAEGKSTCIANVLWQKVLETPLDSPDDEISDEKEFVKDKLHRSAIRVRRLCIVREAGQSTGRLATWGFVR